MAFNMTLWRAMGTKLEEIEQSKLGSETKLEDWISKDSSVLGLDVLLIGRQVPTGNGGRIDLLGIDRQGNLQIIELKRDRTPRDVVAQVLDYASFVKDFTYEDVDNISLNYLKKSLPIAFNDHFGEAIPEKINVNHSMIVVASEIDESSERIVQYLAEEHDVNINVIFFSVFKFGSDELVGRAWLMDPEIVQERSESRKQPPWSGYWFVNVGEGPHRNWDDNRKYGYIGAGQGTKYSNALKHLKIGDKIFAYMKSLGYVGLGIVQKEASMIKDFMLDDGKTTLLGIGLKAPNASENKDDPQLCEWTVGVNWIKSFHREEARTFKGIFANQNVVCKLRHPATIEFLKKEYDVTE